MFYNVLRLRILGDRILLKIIKKVPLPERIRRKLNTRVFRSTLDIGKVLLKRNIFSLEELKILFKQELGVS